MSQVKQISADSESVGEVSLTFAFSILANFSICLSSRITELFLLHCCSGTAGHVICFMQITVVVAKPFFIVGEL